MRRKARHRARVVDSISIHAPREGRDGRQDAVAEKHANFNPRTPQGVRPRRHRRPAPQHGFQSTHPARGATYNVTIARREEVRFQSTHPARGATRLTAPDCNTGGEFQSTHPARGATPADEYDRGEGANFNPRTPQGVRRQDNRRHGAGPDFNPRTPQGVRLTVPQHPLTGCKFQSTHPARGATGGLGGRAAKEADFNPRTPQGVRRRVYGRGFCGRVISIHAPRKGCDR